MSHSHTLFTESANSIENKAVLRNMMSTSKRTLENWLKRDQHNIHRLRELSTNNLDRSSESFSLLPEPIQKIITNPRACFPSLDSRITDEKVREAMQGLVKEIVDTNDLFEDSKFISRAFSF